MFMGLSAETVYRARIQSPVELGFSFHAEDFLLQAMGEAQATLRSKRQREGCEMSRTSWP